MAPPASDNSDIVGDLIAAEGGGHQPVWAHHSATLDNTALQGTLVTFSTLSGVEQMAIDRWLLQQVEMGQLQPPILRFYQWSAPTLSLGYHQSLKSLPLDVLMIDNRVEWVRRPTGGRAVLHQASDTASDVTYSLITGPLQGKRRVIYEELCQFLVTGMASLGVQVGLGQGKRGYIGEASCFRTATSADLCVGDRKVVGSAQMWRKHWVLQHGTILLQPDRHLWEATLPGSSAEVVGINEILTEPVSVEALIASLLEAASSCFGLSGWQTLKIPPRDKVLEQWRDRFTISPEF